MQNWKIDPTTGDYVMSGGAPVETDSLTIPAYIRLKAKRGKWLYAPDNKWGSDFYTILKQPSDNSGKRIEGVALKALQPMVDDGRADSIDATATSKFRGTSSIEVAIMDASGEIVKETFKGLGV